MTEEKSQAPSQIEEFRREWAACWRQLPDKPLFFGLLAVWSVLFHFWGNAVFGWVDTPSLFKWMYFVFDTSEHDGHGKLIPFVVLALFWWKRRELMRAPKAIWWPGMALVLFGVLFHLVGFMVQQTRLSIVGFFLGLYGLMGLVWGRAWLRESFFPMILFVFCVPLGVLNDNLTLPLRLFVAKASVVIGNDILGIPVLQLGSMVYDVHGSFKYDVAAACSGLRSLIALLALTTIYGFVSYRAPWKRLLIVASAIPLAILGNVVRITGVIITADAFGHSAGTFVEQKLGFITFAVAVGCILLLGSVLRDRDRTEMSRLETKAA